MERLMEAIKRKNHIQYDMNCIQKYIEGGDFDGRLKNAWDGLEAELKEIDNEIVLLSNSETRDLEEKRLELLDEIHEHEVAIKKIHAHLHEIEDMLAVKL